MRDFRSGKAPVMVATDVASRGLHIRGLPFIVNYDFPSRLEPYVHRVGCVRLEERQSFTCAAHMWIDLCYNPTTSFAVYTRCPPEQRMILEAACLRECRRTGRLASDGHAFSFLTRNLAPIAQPLTDLLQASLTWRTPCVPPAAARLLHVLHAMPSDAHCRSSLHHLQVEALSVSVPCDWCRSTVRRSTPT